MSLHIYGGLECLRFFPDGKDAKSSFVGFRHVEYDSPDWHALIGKMQENGLGAFVNVNGTDGRGAKAENINRVRAYYVDIDGLTVKDDALMKLITAPLPPSAIVETKNGLHAYWFAKNQKPVDYSEYRDVQDGLVIAFGGDRSAKDIARVLRLPGSLHLKGEPFEVRVVHQLPKGEAPYYEASQLLAHYPAPKRKELLDVPIVNDSNSWSMFLEDLSRWIPSSGDRNMVMLLSAGVAIKYGVDERTFVGSVYPIVKEWGLQRNVMGELRRVADWAYAKGNPIPAKALRSRGVPIREGL